MLPKENRITKKEDFTNVRHNGQIIQSQSFAFAYLESQKDANGAELPSRFGFIVSTKISKKATERNRVKRMLRKIIQDNLPITKSGVDGVFLTKQLILKKKPEEVEQEIKGLFTKLRIHA